MAKVRQVIIGNGAAGLSAIKGIREVDSTCPITLISAENCNAYSPVLLTYYLKGARTREELFIVDDEFYEMKNVNAILGIKAIKVNFFKNTIYLQNGKEVNYDKLLIAVGASPMSLSDSEDEIDNVFSLRSVEDAERILETAKTAKEVVVIGGGLIGLQVLGALFRRDVKFTLVEWTKQVAPELIDAGCAAILQKEIESHGIKILLEKKVMKVSNIGKKAIVILDSGEELISDMVVIGIGLQPNTQLLENSGIKINRGIIVDELMKTNMNNVFAAGDVSEGKDLVTGKNKILPNWPNACNQGRVAGLNMAGCKKRFEGLSEAITTIFGLTIVSIGLPKAPQGDRIEELCFSDYNRKKYRKILFSDNKIVGAILLDKTEDAGILRNLIQKRKNISPWKEEIANTPLDIRKILLSSKKFEI